LNATVFQFVFNDIILRNYHEIIHNIKMIILWTTLNAS